MSCIVINDLVERTDLDQAQLARVVGGVDVKIDRVDSKIESVDDGSDLSADLLAAVVKVVLGGMQRPRAPL